MEHPYTSSELHHFVGFKGPADDELNYNTLLKILDSLCITYRPGEIRFPHLKTTCQWDEAKVRDGKPIVPEVVCFCDIPIGSIGPHIRKYGRFGLSFDRQFLTSMRARPVMYVPNLRHNWLSTKGMFGIGMVRDWLEIWRGSEEHLFAATRTPIREHSLGSRPATPPEAIECIEDVFKDSFLAFIKVFDCELDNEARENYYLEREWRILGELPFQAQNVVRIIVAPNYGSRIANDRPLYADRTYELKEYGESAAKIG